VISHSGQGFTVSQREKSDSRFSTMTGSLPSVPDLATHRYKQAACDRGNPGPEEKMPVLASYFNINGNERKPGSHDHEAAS
jgi:hypothetical protein